MRENEMVAQGGVSESRGEGRWGRRAQLLKRTHLPLCTSCSIFRWESCVHETRD